MANLYNIIKKIKYASEGINTVNDFSFGDIYENMNTKKNNLYPHVNLTITSVLSNSDMSTLQGVLFYVDRLTSDNGNLVEIQSNGMTVLKAVVNRLEEEEGWNGTSLSFTLFQEKFSDLCGGVFLTFSMEVEGEGVCWDDMMKVRVKELKENGTYVVEGWDKVEVNVKESKVGDRGIETIGGNHIEMLDFILTADSIHSLTENIEKINDDKIVDINRSYGFLDCKGLEEVKMTKLERISGQLVFAYCDNLRKVEMNSLKSITGTQIFLACNSLEDVRMDEVERITGSNVFGSCLSLKNVEFPKLGVVGRDAYSQGGIFSNCRGLRTIKLGTIMVYPYLNAGGMFDTSDTMPDLRWIEVGEGTGVNLNFSRWRAVNVRQEEGGVEEMNRMLKEKILDRLQNVENTHYISVGWLEDVTEENIEYAASLGWTLTN